MSAEGLRGALIIFFTFQPEVQNTGVVNINDFSVSQAPGDTQAEALTPLPFLHSPPHTLERTVFIFTTSLVSISLESSSSVVIPQYAAPASP